MNDRRLLVIGLDAAAPELVFEIFRDDLPNLKKMMKQGVYGRLRSCDPPITIPAWMVMVTGVDPGSLGLYGFRERKPRTYNEISLPSSYSVKQKKVWDYIGQKGKKVCLIGIPPTYPPQPVNGWLISCLMTPGPEKEYTYPSNLKKEIEKLVGRYVFDVPFRREDRESVLREIYEMTEKHFKVIEYLVREKPWDFFMFVEIGLDRIQHAFWKYFDENHHLYEPNSKFKNVVREYYKYLDSWIGKLISLIGKNTQIIVVSDHGAKRMKGAFCINEWLIRQGYLKLKEKVNKIKRLEEAKIDWKNSFAWGWGGYYARIFLNVKGREPQGLIDPNEYEDFRKKLISEISRIKGPNGERWRNRVYRPEDMYPICRGHPPDLIVYFDDLYWRSAGTIGYETLYLPENDIGPDDAVHDYDGIFIFYDPRRVIGREVDVNILDIAPTILKLMNIQPPDYMRGELIEEVL